MSSLTGSTEAFSSQSAAESSNIDEEGEHIFALLRPLTIVTQDSFDAVVDYLDQEPSIYERARTFLHATKQQKDISVLSSDTDNSDSHPEEAKDEYHWSGVWKLGLKNLPLEPREGWYLGSGHKIADNKIDLMLAPPDPKWKSHGLCGNHARIFLHPESYRVVLEARHTVFVGSQGATSVLRKGERRVLEHGSFVGIGSFSYVLEHTQHYASPGFESALSSFMKTYTNPNWTLNKLISPASVANPLRIGNYFCSPTAFAGGTYGEVIAGWTEGGSEAVAIKRFKNPDANEAENHKRMMESLSHENILQMLESFGTFGRFPVAYSIYTPLATADLVHAVEYFDIDMVCRATLTRDFLSGLAYLHEDKHFMHRDLSPKNLAIVGTNGPRGVIIDLDSLTSETTSNDHGKGTMDYLAPEVLQIKAWQGRPGKGPPPMPYDRRVDLWALGLGIWSLVFEKLFLWGRWDPQSPKRIDRVSFHLYKIFRKRLHMAQEVYDSEIEQVLLELISTMTEWSRELRTTASELLMRVQPICSRTEGRGRMVPKNRKRGYEQISN